MSIPVFFAGDESITLLMGILVEPSTSENPLKDNNPSELRFKVTMLPFP